MTYIVVRYGSGQELMVNANCVIPSILDYIKEKCTLTLDPPLSEKETIDLASENGEVIYDLSNKGKEYAKKFLEPRCNTILVKVYMETPESQPVFSPLADVSDKVRLAIQNPKKKKILHMEVGDEKKGARPRSRTITSLNQDKQAPTISEQPSPKKDAKKK